MCLHICIVLKKSKGYCTVTVDNYNKFQCRETVNNEMHSTNRKPAMENPALPTTVRPQGGTVLKAFTCGPLLGLAVNCGQE